MEDELRHGFEKAVAHFWRVRARQGAKQRKTKRGTQDRGQRSAVTGGRQLDGFVNLLRELMCGAGLCADDVHIERRKTILPGYFRATKEWDIVATVNDQLLATIEFKSQIGPSFGNNFNNRTEEAVGSAHDLWTAYREGAFSASPRPWVGYVMLLEDCAESSRAVSVDEPHFPVFPEFNGASYAKRYELLCQRLVRERLYDAACLILSKQTAGKRGDFREPSSEIGIAHFASALTAHATGFAKFNPRK